MFRNRIKYRGKKIGTLIVTARTVTQLDLVVSLRLCLFVFLSTLSLKVYSEGITKQLFVVDIFCLSEVRPVVCFYMIVLKLGQCAEHISPPPPPPEAR